MTSSRTPFRTASTYFLAVSCAALASDVAAAQQVDTVGGRPATVVPARTAAAAQRAAESQRRRVDYIDANSLISVARGLAQRNAVGHSVLTSADDQTTYLMVRRTKSSEPEVHARWDDLVLVRGGTGAIEMGDSLIGSRYRAPGERVGGTYGKRYQLVVHPGDIVRIPAAVPHAFIVSGTEPLEYMVIKQRKQHLPIRWFGQP